jgi:hypothetical protein
MRRSGDGVLVDILKGRVSEIFSKGRRYNFGSETLRAIRNIKNDCYPMNPRAYEGLKNFLAPWTARGKDDALSCKFVDSGNM